MNGLTAYQTYKAINLHFNNIDYDFQKYNGKTKIDENKFLKSKFKWQFIGMEKNTETYGHLVQTMFLIMIDNNFRYINDKMLVKRFRYYLKHDIYKDFENDLIYLKKKDKNIFDISTDSIYPIVFDEFIKGKIGFVTLLLLNCCINNFIDKTKVEDPIVWDKESQNVKHCVYFVEFFNRDRVVSLYRTHFLN